jgi:hypothetical protein
MVRLAARIVVRRAGPDVKILIAKPGVHGLVTENRSLQPNLVLDDDGSRQGG